MDAHSSPVAETRERSGKATAIGFGRQAKTETATGRKSGRGQAQAGFVLGSSPSSERSSP